MANYHELEIQPLVLKMINGDLEAKKQIINYYTNYIAKLIENNFNDLDCDKEILKTEMINILHESIANHDYSSDEYFSHYITRKIYSYFFNQLSKSKNKVEHKNREIQELAIKMINGDDDALNKIIEHYSYHIRKLAKSKYNFLNIEEDDLVQIGMVGLLKAITFFKKNQSYYFCTRANTYINKEIEYEITIMNKTPNIEYVGLTNNYINNKSIDLIENTEVKEAIKKLSDIKKKILFLYTYGKYSFDDIGYILGFSHQRAQEHYKHAIEIIKKELDLPSSKQKKM